MKLNEEPHVSLFISAANVKLNQEARIFARRWCDPQGYSGKDSYRVTRTDALEYIQTKVYMRWWYSAG